MAGIGFGRRSRMEGAAVLLLGMILLLSDQFSFTHAQGFRVNVTHISHTYSNNGTILLAIVDKLCYNQCPYHHYMPKRCPSNYYEASYRGTCFYCYPNCPRCDDPERDDWITCALQTMSKVWCGTTRHAVRWFRVRKCARCHPDCEECSGPRADQCTKCPAHKYHVHGRCVNVKFTFGYERPRPCWTSPHGCDRLKHPNLTIVPDTAPPCPTGYSEVNYSAWTCTQCYHGNCHFCRDWAECAYREAQIAYYCKNGQYLPYSVRMCAQQSKACDLLPCANGGNCTNEPTGIGYRCDCQEPFTGPTCRDVKAYATTPAPIVSTTSTSTASKTSTNMASKTPTTMATVTSESSQITTQDNVHVEPSPSKAKTAPLSMTKVPTEFVSTRAPRLSSEPAVSTTKNGGGNNAGSQASKKESSDTGKMVLIAMLCLSILVIVMLIIGLLVCWKRSHKSDQPVDMKEIVANEEKMATS